MADMAASVLARLKNKAAASGRSHQLCLQLFCQEEFLRRLASSRYPENLVSRMFAIPKKRFAATSSVRPEQLRRDL